MLPRARSLRLSWRPLHARERRPLLLLLLLLMMMMMMMLSLPLACFVRLFRPTTALALGHARHSRGHSALGCESSGVADDEQTNFQLGLRRYVAVTGRGLTRQRP